MSDILIPPKPLLQPVLQLKTTPSTKDATLGGKREKDVVTARLYSQRQALVRDVSRLRESSLNIFGGQFLVVAEMFDDSFAPTKSPRDLFRGENGILLRGAAPNGYLVEMPVMELELLRRRITHGMSVPVRCDISRVKKIRGYEESDIYRI